MKHLCNVEVSRYRFIDWIIGNWSLIWISVSFPLLQGPENTNLYSPHWVLSIQSWVLAIPLVYGCRIVFRKSSPDLWKRVNFKSFRRPWNGNRKRIKHEWDNNNQKTTRVRAWSLSLYCISLAPTGYPTRAELLSFPAVALLHGSTSFDYS